jgi:hypothetical protein
VAIDAEKLEEISLSQELGTMPRKKLKNDHQN